MADEQELHDGDGQKSTIRSERIKKNMPDGFTVELGATSGIFKGASLEADRRGDQPEPNYLSLGLVEPPFDMDALVQLLQENPEHWSAVRQKADDAAGLGWDLVPVDEGLVAEEAAEAQAEKDELLEFCNQPNPEQDLREIFMNVDLDWEGIGNGYIELARIDKTNPESKPLAMWHQPAYPIRVKADGSGFVELRPTGKSVHFRPLFSRPESDPDSPGDVMTELYQFKTYNPASPYYGIPDIAASFVSVRAAAAADWWNYVFFLRHAVPEMMVIIEYDTEAYDAEDLKKIRQYIESYFKFELKGQPHKTVVLQLPKGVTVRIEYLSKEQREAQFREYRKELGLEIVRAHRVPPNRVGIFSEAGGTTQGNDAQIVIYKNSVIRPRQEQFENFMLRLFRIGFGARYWRFKFHEIDAQDEQIDSTIASNYSGIDVLAPNESRKKIGLVPFPSPLFDLPADWGHTLRDALLDGKLTAEQVQSFIENGTLVIEARPAGGTDLPLSTTVPGEEGALPIGTGLPAPAANTITDYADGQMREDTEHEQVRQKVERELVEVYGYEKSQLGIEVPVQFGSRSSEQIIGRVDIAVYEQPPSPAEKQRQWRIAVEVKTPGDAEGLEQLESYMNAVDCRWGMWTDGNRKLVIERVGPNRFAEAKDIPAASGERKRPAPANDNGNGNGRRPGSFERTNLLQSARGRGTGH